MSLWFKSRLNPWYIWIPNNPNLYSTKIIMKMRWQTIASNVNTHYQPHCHPTTKSLWLCSSVYCGPPHPSRSRQPKTSTKESAIEAGLCYTVSLKGTVTKMRQVADFKLQQPVDNFAEKKIPIDFKIYRLHPKLWTILSRQISRLNGLDWMLKFNTHPGSSSKINL